MDVRAAESHYEPHHNSQYDSQYSLGKILGLWALVVLPMGLFRFAAIPFLKDRIDFNPGVAYWLLMIAGMAWQLVLSLLVLRSELGTLGWSRLKARLWLNDPIRPKTGRRFRLAYLLTIPFIVYTFLIEDAGVLDFVAEALNKALPWLAPPEYVQIESLNSPEFSGAWYLLGIALASCLFNYLLGEELFFRGVLLPKMNGVFGRWDWVANGALFSLYHVHKLTEVPVFLVGSFFIAYLNKRYRSYWPAVIMHGVEAIPLLVIVLLVILRPS
ncbi:CPBP family intramembrane glutamic endopeptidase [Cohnella fermenti]|nr:CPBP family intramembrane glutamic endopeptidase [Cohnella fermenti]